MVAEPKVSFHPGTKVSLVQWGSILGPMPKMTKLRGVPSLPVGDAIPTPSVENNAPSQFDNFLTRSSVGKRFLQIDTAKDIISKTSDKHDCAFQRIVYFSPFNVQSHTNQTPIHKDPEVCNPKYKENGPHAAFRSILENGKVTARPAAHQFKLWIVAAAVPLFQLSGA